MRTAKRPAALACLVVGILTFAGCTTGQPANGGAAVTLDAAALDSVVRTGSYVKDEQRLDRAERELTRRCMSARGLPYSTAKPDTVSTWDDEWHPDLESRRRTGYGLFDGYSPSAAKPPISDSDREVERWPADRQAAYQTALMGTGEKRAWIDVRRSQRFTFPTDGCIAESRNWLYGSPYLAARIFYVLQNLASMIDQKIRADPAYKAAIAAWAGCMDRHGHPYMSPSHAKAELGKSYRQLGATPALREREVEVAVTDATCAHDSDLPATASTLAKKYAEMLGADDRADLRSLTTSRAAAVERARTVQSR